MSNIYKNDAVRALLVGAAIAAFVLCAAMAFLLVMPHGVAHADWELDGDISGACDGGCGDDIGGSPCCDGGYFDPCCTSDFSYGASPCCDNGYSVDPCCDSSYSPDPCCNDTGENPCCADVGGNPCCDDPYTASPCCDDPYFSGCDLNCNDPFYDDCPEGCTYGSDGELYSNGSHGFNFGSSLGSSRPNFVSYPVSRPSVSSYPVSRPMTFSTGSPAYNHPPVNNQPRSTPVSNTSTTFTNINNSVNGSFNTTNNNSNNSNSNNNTVAVLTPVASYPQPYYTTQYTVPPVYQSYPTYNNNTYCTISASPSNIQSGQYTYLSWSSNGASSAWLSNGMGTVALNGSMAVHPTLSQDYMLTVSDYQGHTNTCHAYVTVGTSAPYVSLSQIPYTGFDFGPVGNAIYWLSLMSFAVAGAYLLVYFQGGALAFASGFVSSLRKSRDEIPSPVRGDIIAKSVEAKEEIELDQHAISTAASDRLAGTTDSMSFVRSHSGVPNIVVSRS